MLVVSAQSEVFRQADRDYSRIKPSPEEGCGYPICGIALVDIVLDD